MPWSVPQSDFPFTSSPRLLHPHTFAAVYGLKNVRIETNLTQSQVPVLASGVVLSTRLEDEVEMIMIMIKKDKDADLFSHMN